MSLHAEHNAGVSFEFVEYSVTYCHRIGNRKNPQKLIFTAISGSVNLSES